jgi:hypothetical protein
MWSDPIDQRKKLENGFHVLCNGTMVFFSSRFLFSKSGVLTLYLLQVSARQEGYLRFEAVDH